MDPRAAVPREGERIVEEGVKRRASGRQRRGHEWWQADRQRSGERTDGEGPEGSRGERITV